MWMKGRGRHLSGYGQPWYREHHLTEHHPLLDRVRCVAEGMGGKGGTTPFEIRNSYANFHTFIFHTLGKQRRELKMIKRLHFFISWLVSCLAHFVPPPESPARTLAFLLPHTHAHSESERQRHRHLSTDWLCTMGSAPGLHFGPPVLFQRNYAN